MKAEIINPNKKCEFKPITIQVTLETEAELATMYAKINNNQLDFEYNSPDDYCGVRGDITDLFWVIKDAWNRRKL